VPFTLAILTVILTYTWWLEPRVSGEFVAVPAAAVLALTLWSAIRNREWGLSARALGPATRAAAIFTPSAVAVMIAFGAALGTLHQRRETLAEFAALAAWGAGQQWVLQTVVLREAKRATVSHRAAIVLAAVLFASVHLPNPFLTSMTFIGALAWCTIYSRHPNLIPLALSHAIATLAILYAFDDPITGRLRIGQAYLRLMM
jgi:membrane protease YdiL (CAAX protease family)